MVRDYGPCCRPSGAIELGCPLRRADGLNFGFGSVEEGAGDDIVGLVLIGEQDWGRGRRVRKRFDSEVRGEEQRRLSLVVVGWRGKSVAVAVLAEAGVRGMCMGGRLEDGELVGLEGHSRGCSSVGGCHSA